MFLTKINCSIDSNDFNCTLVSSVGVSAVADQSPTSACLVVGKGTKTPPTSACSGLVRLVLVRGNPLHPLRMGYVLRLSALVKCQSDADGCCLFGCLRLFAMCPAAEVPLPAHQCLGHQGSAWQRIKVSKFGLRK